MADPVVAILDVDLPPGLAFIRSLGRADVPIRVYSHERYPVGRFSKYSKNFGRSPRVLDTADIIRFFTDGLTRGDFDLIAPTSDYVAFAAVEAFRRAGVTGETGFASKEQLHDCLFKDRFAVAFRKAGFPALVTESPSSITEAIEVGNRIGYPMVVKPRSHVGVGTGRGEVVRHVSDLRKAFVRRLMHGDQQDALRVDQNVALPILQRYLDPVHTDIVSVTGVLDRDGTLLALGHCRKTHQWPPRLGVGTQFEVLPEQAFTASAVAAVQEVLGRGIFELEVLVDRRSGEHWAIDLNPRGFGQMSLDIEHGRDLPALWYRSLTDRSHVRVSHRNRKPKHWRMGLHFHAGTAAELRFGPHKRRTLRAAAVGLTRPTVGAMWHPHDPVPSLLWAAKLLRHPGGLIRPLLRESPGLLPETPA